jgi:hypothetical protein
MRYDRRRVQVQLPPRPRPAPPWAASPASARRSQVRAHLVRAPAAGGWRHPPALETSPPSAQAAGAAPAHAPATAPPARPIGAHGAPPASRPPPPPGIWSLGPERGAGGPTSASRPPAHAASLGEPMDPPRADQAAFWTRTIAPAVARRAGGRYLSACRSRPASSEGNRNFDRRAHDGAVDRGSRLQHLAGAEALPLRPCARPHTRPSAQAPRTVHTA